MNSVVSVGFNGFWFLSSVISSCMKLSDENADEIVDELLDDELLVDDVAAIVDASDVLIADTVISAAPLKTLIAEKLTRHLALLVCSIVKRWSAWIQAANLRNVSQRQAILASVGVVSTIEALHSRHLFPTRQLLPNLCRY